MLAVVVGFSFSPFVGASSFLGEGEVLGGGEVCEAEFAVGFLWGVAWFLGFWGSPSGAGTIW